MRNFRGQSTRLGLIACLCVLSTACDEKNLGKTYPKGLFARSPGLKGEYFKYSDASRPFDLLRKTQVDSTLNFDWESRESPLSEASSDRDQFAIRWTGYVVPPEDGVYVLCTCSDDGVNLSFNGDVTRQLVSQSARFWWTEPMELERGEAYPLKIEYYERTGNASFKLYWAKNPSASSGSEVCSSADLDNGGRRTSDCRSTSNIAINSELSIIPTSVLRPADDELEQAQSECEVSHETVSDSEIPNPYDPNTKHARNLFRRLAGVDVPIFERRFVRVKNVLDRGDLREAARIVTEEPSFYDVTVRRFAARMSTREERPDVSLNDFTATMVGATRDELDARLLLTGDFLYRGKSVFYWFDPSSASRMEVVESQSHYEKLENDGISLKCALDTIPRFDTSRAPASFKQILALPESGSNRTSVDLNPDPAGVLTSRSFAEAHLIAGTNRRAVQKAFEYFLCAPIDTWRDAELSDYFVGRDVERFPNGAGSYREYLTNCKTCHAPLDAMRGAFAPFHFENNILKHADLFMNHPRSVSNNEEQVQNMRLTSEAHRNNPDSRSTSNLLPVHWKLNHNVNYEDGYFMEDNHWENFLTTARHRTRFGWTGGTEGSGVRAFGHMLASSAAYPRCMARRVYREVCGANPLEEGGVSEETQVWLNGVGDEFASNGFNLKELFIGIGTRCME